MRERERERERVVAPSPLHRHGTTTACHHRHGQTKFERKKKNGWGRVGIISGIIIVVVIMIIIATKWVSNIGYFKDVGLH